MNEILQKLEKGTFSPLDALEGTTKIVRGEATEGQIAAFLIYLQHLDKTPQILAALTDALLSNQERMKIDCCDIVGTGGDGFNTFNVSTASGIIAAGAGCKVAKHGNRSSSSNCGSADILEALGVNLEKDTELVKEYFTGGDFVFLFAQKWHTSMKVVSKVRQELGVRTIFNILGPLINPFSPKFMVVGVYKKDLGFLFASTLKELKVERAWVVHGKEGLDEISPNGKTIVWELKDGIIREFEISPDDFGLSRHSLDTVKGNKQDNKRNMEELLMGKIKTGPLLEYVLMNTSALLFVSGLAKDLEDGVGIAKHSIYSGRAWNALQNFKEFTNS